MRTLFDIRRFKYVSHGGNKALTVYFQVKVKPRFCVVLLPGAVKKEVYFMAIIDILTHYDAKKKAAHAAKTVKHGVSAETHRDPSACVKGRRINGMVSSWNETVALFRKHHLEHINGSRRQHRMFEKLHSVFPQITRAMNL